MIYIPLHSKKDSEGPSKLEKKALFTCLWHLFDDLFLMHVAKHSIHHHTTHVDVDVISKVFRPFTMSEMDRCCVDVFKPMKFRGNRIPSYKTLSNIWKELDCYVWFRLISTAQGKLNACACVYIQNSTTGELSIGPLSAQMRRTCMDILDGLSNEERIMEQVTKDVYLIDPIFTIPLMVNESE